MEVMIKDGVGRKRTVVGVPRKPRCRGRRWKVEGKKEREGRASRERFLPGSAAFE